MLARLTAAATRGISVAFLVTVPSLLLPASAAQSSEIVVFMALTAAGLIFAEYFSKSPSILEFRDAPPLNRMRLVFVGLCLTLLSMLARHAIEPTGFTALLSKLAVHVGEGLDVPFSPVSLIVWALPDNTSVPVITSIRASAGLSYTLSVMSVAVFVLMIRGWNWPVTNGAFNVWINLPLFDPTTGSDVVIRLQRDGWLHIAVGVLLPFVLPVAVRSSSHIIQQEILSNPQVIVWCLTGWAMVPAGLIVRGMARLRVAELIVQKRRALGQEQNFQIA